MSIVNALDGVNSILAIIKKGDATPEKKLETILEVAEGVRNDIQDVADKAYADYIDELPPPTFDMEQAIADLLEKFRKQEFANLFYHYDKQVFADEADPHIRLAIATALVKFAIEQQKAPSAVWSYIIQNEGVISEA
uniref:Uncharacterized protein n=1 Tax=Pseudomonas phage HRDY3 TaxID=3236930 RepID=A0AB39CE85_9VIRU